MKPLASYLYHFMTRTPLLDADRMLRRISDGGCPGSAGKLFLAAAAETGLIQHVNFLLNAGADIHAYGNAALRLAAMNGHSETVELLLDDGADVHACGDSALRLAATNGHARTVETLLHAGADFQGHGEALLGTAARNGHAETLTVLMRWMERMASQRAEGKRSAVPRHWPCAFTGKD